MASGPIPMPCEKLYVLALSSCGMTEAPAAGNTPNLLAYMNSGWPLWTAVLTVSKESLMTNFPPPSMPAGWYPDPQYPGFVRWWDGVGWTVHTQPQRQQQFGGPRAAGPTSRGKVLWILGGVAALLVLVIAVAVGSFGSGFSDEEERYLEVVHDPCGTDVVKGSGFCDLVWEGSDSDLVDEGNKVCDLELSTAPGLQRHQKASDYLSARHPYYSYVQVNTQIIAAEQVLCPEVY